MNDDARMIIEFGIYRSELQQITSLKVFKTIRSSKEKFMLRVRTYFKEVLCIIRHLRQRQRGPLPAFEQMSTHTTMTSVRMA